MNDTLKTIFSRKSVRRYTDQPVRSDDIETLLKAGMAAPSAGDRQPWVFVVTTKREGLIQLAQGLQYGTVLANAQSAIVVCGDMEKAFPDTQRDFWVQDCSAATQNILLAAEAIGLGAVWIGVYPMDDRVKFVQSALKLPGKAIPLGIVSIGYPQEDEHPKDKYRQDNIHREKW